MRYPKMILIIIMVLFIFSFTIQAANYGGELNIKLQQRPINLNPIYAANKAEKIISQQIFDSLVTLNAEGELIPNLAKTWEINNQARVFRFKLRENIYFHPFQINGALSSLSKRRVTAADWKWSLEYLAASENKSPYANLLNKVKGYEEYRQGRSKEISGIKILDDYLLEIELKESYAPFIYNLTENAAVVLPEQAVLNNSKFFMEPIGTGAFVLNNFNPDQIILKKFDNYWKNNYRKERLPYLDRIKIDFSANESEIKEYHNYDIYQLSSELYQKYSELEKTDNYQLKKTAENIYYYLGYNYNSSLKKVISDQNIKEYLRNSLNEINLEQNDDLLSFIFPFQYSKEASYIDQINNLVKKNNDNNLKDEAYPEQLNLVSNDSKNNKVIADLIKNELQDKKIKLNLSQFSWSEYLNLIKSKDFK
ncbi:peptide/nickel transport system substrate-binding protein [Halanaerobium sp. ST460_2HS_T2]|nr:ABC transporter substrate-binding protein [Halanaerobium sp. ST460_2HS_T2]RCW57418.1 peptide/nickel transport system substrate-binding protein [Halanaerobium sp. ST460_2HS_T2]